MNDRKLPIEVKSAWRYLTRRQFVRSATGAGAGALLGSALRPVKALARQPGNAYHQTNLVSDLPGLAQLTDPDLVNPWGLVASPTSPAWVADNGTDKATIYPGFVNGSP